MKEAVGGVSLFQIVVLFILLFTAIMCLTINNANAFQIKDEIASIIETSEGNFVDSKGNLNGEMVDAIANSAYRVTGKCEDGYIGYNRDGTRAGSGESASICIKCVNVTTNVDAYLKGTLGDKVATQGHSIHGYYYKITVFYQLDLPVINQVYDFKTRGETFTIYNDSAYCRQA